MPPLLMGLIWSFHLQYDQPASFYLKAPTLLYVFIFIALRALRFDPVYVLASGLVAAAGWVFLLLYALFLDDNHIGGPMITGDYIEYMTSYHILVGAEVDKIVSILVVTGILALVLVRARRTLEKAVSDGATAASLSRFVADDVVQKVTEGEAELKPGDAEEKIATVMFTDIEGFSTISEAVSPTELMDLLNDYFEKVTQVLDRHEGLVAQFQGDALMVVFRNHEDFDPATITPGPDMPRICAHRAVAAAREIVETLNDHPFGGLEIPMRTRCGLNTGVMVLGTVGSHNRLIFTAHGDEVNIAARLEQLNKQYGSYILMSEGTAQMSGQFEAMREMGEVVVRGRSTPTRVYSVGPQLAPAQPYLSPIGSGRPEAAQ
ncbi:MAG: adenylate/guanylate cyclase domain-containing protein [Rhodospirillaceae bacterium]